jgi:hypothetical protein
VAILVSTTLLGGVLEWLLVRFGGRFLAPFAFVPLVERIVALTAAARARLEVDDPRQGYRSARRRLDLGRLGRELSLPHVQIAAHGARMAARVRVEGGLNGFDAVVRLAIVPNENGLRIRARGFPRFALPLLGFFGTLAVMARSAPPVCATFVGLALFLETALAAATRGAIRDAASRVIDDFAAALMQADPTLDARQR